MILLNGRDIAGYKNLEHPANVIKNWTRSKDTIEFLGLWEKINNHSFKLVEFHQFRNQAGSNSFVIFARRIGADRGGYCEVMGE